MQFHLITHDIGTPIGLALTSIISDRVRSITILNSMLNMENFTQPLPMRPFEKTFFGEAELAAITHTTWQWMMKYAGVINVEAMSKEEIAAYVYLLKREDNGRAFLKIMRHFDRSKAFTSTCYSAVQNSTYPVQLIWGNSDPFLPFHEYGVQFKNARPEIPYYKVEAKHFLQEEQYEFIAKKVKEFQ